MKDEQCVRFLDWALPRLHLRWPGWCRQVCKRIDRRLKAFDRLAGAALARDAEVYLIDEIGKMERLSSVFVGRVGQPLAAGKAVIAILAQHRGGFIEAVKRRPEVERWEVRRVEWEVPAERALAWLGLWEIAP